MEKIIIGLIFLGIFALFMFARRNEKKWEAQRQRMQRDLAEQWGMGFELKAWPELSECLTHFHYFRSSRSPDFINIIHGHENRLDVYVIDFRITRHDKRSGWISAICIAGLKESLPPFRVIPRRSRDELWFSKWKNVDISGFDALSKISVVAALDPEAFRRVIPSAALELLGQGKDLYIEGFDTALLISPQFGTLTPDELGRIKALGLKLAMIFSRP